jgi:phthiocerol/phenolphthiocerol synthesis type-I polyketide synthase C
VSVLAEGGRYVDLTKHLIDGEQVGFADLPANASYAAVDICHLSEHRPRHAGRLLREVFRLVRAGVLTPLPHRVFGIADAGTAFGVMARAEHTGKVVLSFDGSRSAVTPGTARAGSGRLAADAGYLVTGGLGGLGIEVARWLAGRGARQLLLLGRTALPPRAAWPSAGGADRARIDAIQDLERTGVVVRYAAVDVADEAAVRAALQQFRSDGAPAIRGVVHTAGVIDVRPAEELTGESVADALAPKLTGGWVLHTALADAALDFFVLFSSGSAVIGSPMLGAYAAGNAALDGLAWHRRAAGLRALSVNWGFWSQAGMAARFEQQHGRSMTPEGAFSFTPAQGLAALGALLDADATQATVFPADWNRWAAAYPDAAQDPVLRDLLPARRAEPVASSTPAVVPATSPQPESEATPEPAEPPDMEAFLVSRVARAMGLTPSQVDPHRPLNGQGLDSLMATEVRVQVQQTHGVLIPITKMLSGMSVAELAAEAVNGAAAARK